MRAGNLRNSPFHHFMFIIICIFITYIIIICGQNEFFLEHSIVRTSLYINIITTYKSIFVGSNSSFKEMLTTNVAYFAPKISHTSHMTKWRLLPELQPESKHIAVVSTTG